MSMGPEREYTASCANRLNHLSCFGARTGAVGTLLKVSRATPEACGAGLLISTHDGIYRSFPTDLVRIIATYVLRPFQDGHLELHREYSMHLVQIQAVHLV